VTCLWGLILAGECLDIRAGKLFGEAVFGQDFGQFGEVNSQVLC
jgi:hypothetical protein